MDLFEALSLGPKDGNRTPTQQSPARQAHLAQEHEWSTNVEQLIRETDEAFQAAGFALADAKSVTREFGDHTVEFGSFEPRSPLRKQHQIPTQATKTLIKSDTKKLKKSEDMAPKVQPTKSSSRWTLTDGMADIFCSRMFSRIQADELLTPDRIRQIKVDKEEEVSRKLSIDTFASTSSDGTPVDPFHLDGLSARLDAVTLLPPAISEPTAALPQTPIPSVPRKSVRCSLIRTEPVRDKSTGKIPKENDLPKPLQFHNLMFPSPPRSVPHSRSLTGSLALPTIPETSIPSPSRPNRRTPVTSPSAAWPSVQPHTPTHKPFNIHRSVRELRRRTRAVNAPAHKALRPPSLRSTPYTLTAPGFRHGAIRLSKTARLGSDELDFDFGVVEHLRAVRTRRQSADMLDWTAFQMAISGGAGDFLLELAGDDCEDRELDDLYSWWEGIGMDLGEVQRGEGPEGGEHLDLFAEDGKARWETVAAKWPPGPEQSGYDSEESLPDSPMGELNSGIGFYGSAPVMMGFNLGHDLGDFLRWETEHVDLMGDY